MSSSHLRRTLVLLLLIFPSAFAQTPAPTAQTDEQRKAQKELESKALILLDDAIKDSESFKHAENRARIRMTAANILWEHDEGRARILIKEAMTELTALLKSQEAGDAPENPRAMEGPNALRGELLMMLAQRDPRLAREFMRATRPQGANPKNSRAASPDQQMEMNLAMQVAATDPKQALEMAEENLSGGLSYEMPQMLSALRTKDPEAAARLATEVMAKIRSEKLDSSEAARNVAVSLLREATQEEEGGSTGAKARTPLLDQQALRELTEMIAAEALRPSSPNSPELLSALQEMLPAVERYAPARVAQLKRRFPQPTSPGNEGKASGDAEINDGDVTDMSAGTMNVEGDKYRAIIGSGSVDELLAEAAKAPEGVRDMLYQRAVAKLAEDGEFDRARQVINERIKDPEQRKQMLSNLDEVATMKAAERGEIEQTRKLLATLRTNEERVMALAQLASGAAAKGNRKAALQMLEEARGMMVARAKNFNQLGAQLAVARAYAPLDASRSLSILEPVVDQLNELITAAVVLGGFMAEEIVNDDEIMMGPLAMISNELFTRYIGDLNALARADFERTRALADRFLRDEVRISARLLIAQSILAPHPVEAGATVAGVGMTKP